MQIRRTPVFFHSRNVSLAFCIFLVHLSLSNRQSHLNDYQATSQFGSLRDRQHSCLYSPIRVQSKVIAIFPVVESRFECLKILFQF